MLDPKLSTYDPEALRKELIARNSESPEKKLTGDKRLGEGPTPLESTTETPDPSLEIYSTEKIAEALRLAQKVVYDVDDREDMFDVQDLALLTDASSVVSLVYASDIRDNGNGTFTLEGPTFGAKRNLCDSEPFREQITVPFCTGFLVAPSMIATAAHCIGENNIDNVRFVFGFEMSDRNTAETTLSNSELYRGTRIVGRQLGPEGSDWALVQLDRPVLNHPSVRIRRRGKVSDQADVHVIGHPSGLPKKYAGNAIVRANDQRRYFSANLDTYGGNSGSPVFNSRTHEVEGILVRGETDFVQLEGCNISNVCPVDGCGGEACTRTTEFASLVPEWTQDCIPFSGSSATVEQIGGRWKIVASGMLLLDFGSSKEEADRALSIIKYYGMNSQCFVGRPQASMEYFLVDGQAPEGAMAGEDAIAFNPEKLEVKLVRDRWTIVEGTHALMNFDQQEAEARQALSHILRYGFRYSCYVGRPNPSMRYFRK